MGPTGPRGTATTSKSRTKWLIAGGGAAGAVIAAIVVIIIVTSNSPKPPPTASAVDSAGLDSILLSSDEIHAIVGRSDLTATEVIEDLDDTSLTISDPNCAGVLGTALESVYAGSGHTSVRDQAFTREDPRFFIAQTAVLFSSADQARTFMSTSADKWSRCVGQTFSIASSTGDERWTVGEVARSDFEVMQQATGEGAGGYACQHVLRAVSNVVLEAVACHDNVSDDADRIAEKLAANVPV